MLQDFELECSKVSQGIFLIPKNTSIASTHNAAEFASPIASILLRKKCGLYKEITQKFCRIKISKNTLIYYGLNTVWFDKIFVNNYIDPLFVFFF